MARIIEIVRTRRDTIRNNSPEAERTGLLAVAALTAGVHTPAGTPTPAWQAYMEHFPGLDADQLKRLLATDGTKGDVDLDRKRAYLVANAVCGANSPNTELLDLRVNSVDHEIHGAACDPPTDLFI